MPQPDRIPAIPLHDEHVVTAREALEGLYLKLQQEAEVRMVAAALRAGWSAEEAHRRPSEGRRAGRELTRRGLSQ
ncbi:hypothetical protein AB3480_09965 [Rhizobium mongolense]